MNSTTNLTKLLLSALLLILLVSCQDAPITSQVVTTDKLPKVVSTFENYISPMENKIKVELTYFSECEFDYKCMYAIEIFNIESDEPILGVPQVIFKLPRNDTGPKIPVLFSSWSPDGLQIAIVASGINGRPDIFVSDSTGKEWTNITNSPDSEWEVSWAPDGHSLIFTAKSGDPDSPIKIYSISPNGDDRRQMLQELDSLLTNIHSPSWSPDGKQIIFNSIDEYGSNQIFIANSDGANLQQITHTHEDNIAPRFSQKGDWILYRQEERDLIQTSKLFLIRPDGTDEHTIINDDHTWKVEPNWSPIGDWIAFLEIKEKNSDIYLVQSGNGIKIRVTNNTQDEFSLGWRITIP